MGFDFSIVYKRGCENRVADALSRRDEVQLEQHLVAISAPILHWLDAVREEQGKSTLVQAIVQWVHDDDVMGPWELRDGLLLFKDRLYLPANSTLKHDIIQQFHNGSHEGFHKTLRRIRANFY